MARMDPSESLIELSDLLGEKLANLSLKSILTTFFSLSITFFIGTITFIFLFPEVFEKIFPTFSFHLETFFTELGQKMNEIFQNVGARVGLGVVGAVGIFLLVWGLSPYITMSNLQIFCQRKVFFPLYCKLTSVLFVADTDMKELRQPHHSEVFHAEFFPYISESNKTVQMTILKYKATIGIYFTLTLKGFSKKAVVLNSTGRVTMDEIYFLHYPVIHTDIYWLKKKISTIQNKLDTCLKTGQPHNQLNIKLSHLRQKLSSMVTQELGCLVNDLMEFILQMSQRYNLFISIGYPKDIKNSNKRGRVNKTLRRMLHDWSYRSFITKLKFKLHQQGFEHYRVIAVNERDTSKTCSRCLSTNTSRFKQGRFICRNCNYEINADLNGARNMAKRLIQYVLEPSGNFQTEQVLQDYLSGDFHKLNEYGDFHPLSQWLKYSSGDTSFL